MKKLDLIIENYPDTKLLTADGFDDAVLGIAFDKASGCDRLVYSVAKCIEILMERDGMTYEIAVEFFDFNVRDAYVGKETPLWMDDEIDLLNDETDG